MSICQELKEKKFCLSVVGLGYVGLPLAVEFSKKINVIGFDISVERVNSYKNGIDLIQMVGDDELKKSSVFFTSNENDLNKAMFYIITVPTPINSDRTPDLNPIKKASETVGRCLKKGAYVVYESTVYPGVTEDICIPILEKVSGLRCGTDFKVGYSPERINPGDDVNTVTQVVKVVSGIDEECLNQIAELYRMIVKPGVYKAENIKVAEAAKIMENTQRDINIAFMNEMAIIFNNLGVETEAVINASKTKWNFLSFKPGLVGGHCIGVDPYYLTYRAEQIGYHPMFLLSARRINDNMGIYIGNKAIEIMVKEGVPVKGSRALVLGLSFKENINDVRNTKVVDIIEKLKEFDISIDIFDPVADVEAAKKEYGVDIVKDNVDINNKADIIICAVAHDCFKEIHLSNIKKKFFKEKTILLDVKGIYDKDVAEDLGFIYWRL